MRKIGLIACFMVLGVLNSCIHKSNTVYSESKKWSVIIADATMHRYEALINMMETPKWQYDVSMLGRAIAKISLYEDTNGYFNYMKCYTDYFVEEDGSVKQYKIDEYNLDRIQPARNLIWLYEKTNKEKYKKAILSFIEQLKKQPITTEGGFWHKKIYPHQMWLDGIYMACPFMAEYGKKFDQPEWFSIAAKQIILIYQKTHDSKTGLLYHAWDESRKELWCDPVTGQSKVFWGRGIGWYVMGIVDVLEFLPLDNPDRLKLIEILNKTAESLLKVQDKQTGLWHQVLDKPDKKGNYIEASCSAMFGYAFAKGAKNGYLEEKYLTLAQQIQKKIIQNLIRYDNENLPVMINICGGCGLGGDPYRDGSYDYYVSEQRVVNDPKGLAPFILFSLELENL
jgi:unsaturated rhamnogalacturonyl hydrolase